MLNRFSLNMPSSVVNALNANQILHKIITYLDDMADVINHMEDHSKEYTDQQIQLLYQKVKDDLQELTALVNQYTDIKVEQLDTKTSAKDTELDTKIDTIEHELYKYIDKQDNKLLARIVEFENYILKIIEDISLAMYSPVDGFYKSTSDVIIELFNYISNKTNAKNDTWIYFCNAKNVTWNTVERLHWSDRLIWSVLINRPFYVSELFENVIGEPLLTFNEMRIVPAIQDYINQQ